MSAVQPLLDVSDVRRGVRALAGLHGRAQPFVLGIPVGRFRVLADEHGGEPPGASDVFGKGRIRKTKAVKSHVALALVVPLGAEAVAGNPVLRLVQIIVLVVDVRPEALAGVLDAVVARSGRRVPAAQRHVQHDRVRAHAVEVPPHRKGFV